LIHRLEEKGLVDVVEYPDAQEKAVRLSPAGRGIVDGLLKAGEKLDKLAGK
jgi:DNA-binding MarR family transcriptional regulator